MSDKQTKILMIIAVVFLIIGVVLAVLVPDVQILQNVVGLVEHNNLSLGVS